MDIIKKLFLTATASAHAASTTLATAVVGVVTALFGIVVINALLTLEEVAVKRHLTKTLAERNTETTVVHVVDLLLSKYVTRCAAA